STFAIFQGPAFTSAVTMLIPDAHRDRANAIQQLTGPAAGLVAPVLAGVLFAVIGVTGVMVIDLFTFGVAMVVILSVHIPRPAPTDEGKAMEGDSVWRQAFAGFRYLRTKGMLLWLIVCATVANFLLGGALVLNTPYILTLTDSEAMLGVLLGVMSLGPLVGGIIMSARGGTRPRIHTILPGIAMEGVFLALYGITRSPVAMGFALFFVLFPIPFVNASFMSLLQIKIPADLQGRVFSSVIQLAMLLNPLTYLIAGPLADQIAEPAVGGKGWSMVEPLVGAEPGAGMGLVMVVYGVLMIVTMLGAYALPAMRRMEAELPDYEAVAVAEDIEDAAPELGGAGPEPAPAR
ncbi:MAG: MFS transporter, partial [Anaerolineae bacterium]|nr:MFS transporter [Anaerolineae bacterium]